MRWSINIRRRIEKRISRLPKTVQASLVALIREIAVSGPVRGNWANYDKLGLHRHHCHLKKGQPTYVAVWEVIDTQIHVVEITYVGTHEDAPY